MNSPFNYGIDSLTPGQTIALAQKACEGVLSQEALQQLRRSHDHVSEIVAAESAVYGINTGFGPLCTTRISSEETSRLQHNLLQSHAVGVGPDLAPLYTRIMLILKLHALCRGYSGVRPEIAERILWMITNDILPIVPQQGSVGASGDLAPLAHLFLPLIGLGRVHYRGRIVAAAKVLQESGLSPVTLGPKEGLALINGTQFIAAHAVVALSRLLNLLNAADIIGALSLEGLMGSARPFDPRLHALRPFTGNQLVARRLMALLERSDIQKAHADCDRVQDPYSLRCMPQVHGATRTAWQHLQSLTEIEINAVTDNPIVLGPFDAISGGNFHGEPLAVPLDYTTIAAAELGSISERRSYLSIEGRYDLPKLLIAHAGLHSGFMVPQYTAAALVSENKSLCFPASVDSIPTALGQEDHVSMGAISGRKINQVLDNLENILAIELLYAAQAIDFRRPLQSSPVLEAAHAAVRKQVRFADEDRIFAEDIAALRAFIAQGQLVGTVHHFAQIHGLSAICGTSADGV